MICKDIQILLIEKMFGRLSDPDKARVEEHLRACPACRRLAERSPDLAAHFRPAEDIPWPDKEATWQAIARRTGLKRRPRLAPFWKWAAVAGGAAVVLLAVIVGRSVFRGPGRNALSPLSAASNSFLSSYTEAVEIVLLSTLNGAGQEDLSKAESRLLEDLLFQTRMLKQVVARMNDASALRLIDDIEMILTDLAHRKSGDKESWDFLVRAIEEKDLKFQVRTLSGFSVGLENGKL
jgi:hypothetical protein